MGTNTRWTVRRAHVWWRWVDKQKKSKKSTIFRTAKKALYSVVISSQTHNSTWLGLYYRVCLGTVVCTTNPSTALPHTYQDTHYPYPLSCLSGQPGDPQKKQELRARMSASPFSSSFCMQNFCFFISLISSLLSTLFFAGLFPPRAKDRGWGGCVRMYYVQCCCC